MTLHRLPHAPPGLALPDLGDVDQLDAEALVAFATEAAALLERARARLALAGARPAPATPTGDRLLTADEVAARLGVSRDHVYRQARRWPFTRYLGRACRFSEAGLARWLAARRTGGA